MVYWNTGFDDCDLYFWDNGVPYDIFAASQANSGDIEPPTAPFATDGINPGEKHCVSVYFWLEGDTSGSTGQPYTLYVRAAP